jgi:hypothetical protein
VHPWPKAWEHPWPKAWVRCIAPSALSRRPRCLLVRKKILHLLYFLGVRVIFMNATERVWDLCRPSHVHARNRMVVISCTFCTSYETTSSSTLFSVFRDTENSSKAPDSFAAAAGREHPWPKAWVRYLAPSVLHRMPRHLHEHNRMM